MGTSSRRRRTTAFFSSGSQGSNRCSKKVVKTYEDDIFSSSDDDDDDDCEKEEEEEEAVAESSSSRVAESSSSRVAQSASKRKAWSPIQPVENRKKNDNSKKKKKTETKKNAFDVMMRRFDEEEEEEEEEMIASPSEMFEDMLRRFPEIGEFSSRLRRPLRVATMCSGTEAPLIALRLLGVPIEHAFSSEVEPFKQAYIERNFRPPLLFRDVRELGEERAHTAFGALAEVPRSGVDVLIAGTSCVDYSSLNREKKSIEARGESGQTFYGMYAWVKRARPAVVLLENVCGAPWEGMVANFREIGYSAKATRLDTKKYYLPQTRTRGYMLAIAREKCRGDETEWWAAQLKAMERPATASLEAFMLSAHDPRVAAAREDLKKRTEGKHEVPWDKCEARHARVRADEELGTKRPVTNWAHGTRRANLPDFAWRDWARAQTERVLDSIDIDYVRLVLTGQDAHFKTSVWDLSQNVDRSNPTTSKLGICPCLTPSLCAFVTNQGRPVVGVETLALQGIPIDDLILTRESEDNLTSLSGNAMSTTVVGSALAAAFLVLPDDCFLSDDDDDDDDDDKEGRRRRRRTTPPPTIQEVDEAQKSSKVEEAWLVEEPLDLSGGGRAGADPAVAVSASRACACEAANAVAAAKILTCKRCGHTACEKCAGKPEHDYDAPRDMERGCPSQVAREIGASVPALLDFWVEDAKEIPKTRFEFARVERGERSWTVHYAAAAAAARGKKDEQSSYRLELSICKEGRRWYLRAPLPRKKGPERDRLATPIMRGAAGVSGDVSKWEYREIRETRVRVEAFGEEIPAFEATLGIEKSEFKDKKRSSAYKVDATCSSSSFSGIYDALPACSAPLASLHKHRTKNLFLFLDSQPVGSPSDDVFVVAKDWKKLGLGERRTTECEFPKGWNLFEQKKKNEKTTTVVSASTWVPVEAKLEPAAHEATIAYVSRPLSFEADDPWTAKVIFRSRGVDLGVAVPRLRLPEVVAQWTRVSNVGVLVDRARRGEPCCVACAPEPPSLRWVRVAGTGHRYEALEDPYAAGVYERALKNRPTTFAIRRDEDTLTTTVAFDATALAARAFGSLPRRLQRETGDATLEWRIVVADDDDDYHREDEEPGYRLASNRKDDPAPQPDGFEKVSLRPEQLRSLAWMRKNENDETVFVEEEVVDETLGVLGWRAEARASVPVATIRGGVLADAVGYGKTAVTLGLIDAEWTDDPPILPFRDDRAIPAKATLVIVPKHLLAQWPAELKKFLGNRFSKVLSIATVGDLKSLKIKDVLEAEIIFCAVQAFRSQLYFDRLSDFASVDSLPAKGGRYFEEVHARAVSNVEKYCDVLVKKGPTALSELRAADEAELLEKQKEVAVNTSKKQAYRDGNQKEDLPPPSPPPQKKNKKKMKMKITTARCCRRSSSSSSSSSYLDVEAPPLELFYFARKVVDEFTYLDARDVPTIQAIKARSSWVLSGTPPVESFDDVKKIAAYLGIHLGAPDPAHLSKKGRPKAAELSKSEVFHEFLEVRSRAWRARRRKVAQAFLDRFVRQNVAEIDEIPFEQRIVSVRLTAAERAVYLELEHHLTALEMQKSSSSHRARRHRAGSSDRDRRLKLALDGSADAEEALLKRCSHFDDDDLDFNDLGGGGGGGNNKKKRKKTDPCSRIVAQRRAELAECAHQIEKFVATAHRLDEELRRWSRENPTGLDPAKNLEKKLFDNSTNMWVGGVSKKKWDDVGHAHLRQWRSEVAKGLGDPDADRKLRDLADLGLANAKKQPSSKTGGLLKKRQKDAPPASSAAWRSKGDAILVAAKERRLEEDLDLPVPVKPGNSANDKKERFNTHKELMWALREQVYELRALNKEYVARTRSLRFFEAIQAAGPQNHGVFSCCGHAASVQTLRDAAKQERCILSGCLAPVRPHSIVEFTDFFHSPQQPPPKPPPKQGNGGAKLSALLDLIDSIPPDDRLLVFVQFPDLLTKVEAVLEARADIRTLKIKGTAHQMMQAMTAFQNPKGTPDDPRVLLLELHNESASGANLTTANHIVFVHPLHVDTLQKYVACETQAIGRARRYGQKKKVFLHRLLVEDTIDTALYAKRTHPPPL
ncbi:hypothetical protein CTAYLR_010750 [Chrysophaeum taylorii]|uniref:Helicase ATP-binding domain-containing protein n=1 Tax=Chrysophaeum taylorii TaxID=2483200 RepID=A0AAD7U606_9STRA|nr:hypothetical protein CTAYLR_010750 [Chrysophaeum taylorii]